jgi:hypothetical protein
MDFYKSLSLSSLTKLEILCILSIQIYNVNQWSNCNVGNFLISVQYGNATDYFYSLHQLTSRYKLETQQMQAGFGAGKWGPLQGEEQVQQLGVQSCGTGDPIYQTPLFNVEQHSQCYPINARSGQIDLNRIFRCWRVEPTARRPSGAGPATWNNGSSMLLCFQ